MNPGYSSSASRPRQGISEAVPGERGGYEVCKQGLARTCQLLPAMDGLQQGFFRDGMA